MTDAAGKRTFDYNSEMQRSSETLPSDFYGDKVLTNKYEDNTGTKSGRDKGFKLGTSTDPDADIEITYGYGDKGRLNAVTDSNGTYNYSYVTDSDMVETTDYPNNLSATRKYESNRNVVDYVQNDIEDTTVSKYNYTNDAAGKRTDVERTGTAFNQSDEIVYNYNDRSEVTGAESSVDDNYDYSYAYDNIGNRRSSGNEVNSYLTWNRDYTANNLNQYESVNNELELSTRWWEWTFDWDTQPQHDADGNMTYLPSWTGNWELTWNAENRLVKAVSAYTKLEFTYDYKGRRIQKKVFERDTTTDDWSLHTDHRFIYNGWNPIYQETTTDSSQPSSFAKASEDTQLTVKTYTWGLDLSGQLQGAGGVGGLLAVNINEVEAEPKSRPRRASGHQASSVQNPFFTTYNANGNVSGYINTNGNTVAHYEYSPFGRLTAAEGSMAADFNHRFSTKYQDNETGLYYYGYRYYSVELGRWLSRDPIGERGGVNVYSFLGNTPSNAIEYHGLFKLSGLLKGLITSPAFWLVHITRAVDIGSYKAAAATQRSQKFDDPKTIDWGPSDCGSEKKRCLVRKIKKEKFTKQTTKGPFGRGMFGIFEITVMPEVFKNVLIKKYKCCCDCGELGEWISASKTGEDSPIWEMDLPLGAESKRYKIFRKRYKKATCKNKND